MRQEVFNSTSADAHPEAKLHILVFFLKLIWNLKKYTLHYATEEWDSAIENKNLNSWLE